MELTPEHRRKDQLIKFLTDGNEALENYFRNTFISQLFFDKGLKLRKFTPAAMKQFDLSEYDIGRSIYVVENKFRYPSIIHNIKWVMAKGKILEKKIQTPDLRWYQMNILPYITLIANKPTGVIVNFIDITNGVKYLKDKEKIIEEYETLLDTISHDIKNRLTGMSLSNQMMKDADLSDKEEAKTYLNTLNSGLPGLN